MKTLPDDVSVDKQELIKFWKSSVSRSRSGNFWKVSSTLQDRAFFNSLVHVSGKSDRIFMQFYQKCIFEQGSPRYILEVIQIWTLDLD